jgi:hypothetical protein
MSLTDCVKCWESPCMCGHEWRKYTPVKLREQIEVLQRVLLEKEPHSGRCANCKHWGGPVGRLDGVDAAKKNACQLLNTIGAGTVLAEFEVLTDGSYHAVGLRTDGNFGCVLFEAKEEG